MTNDDDAEKYYYFAVKRKLELCTSEWLRNKKKEAITNAENCFQNALNDALDYQRIKKEPQKISKIKPFISKYSWKDIEFPSHQKRWKKFEYIICTTQYKSNKYCMQIKI